MSDLALYQEGMPLRVSDAGTSPGDPTKSALYHPIDTERYKYHSGNQDCGIDELSDTAVYVEPVSKEGIQPFYYICHVFVLFAEIFQYPCNQDKVTF